MQLLIAINPPLRNVAYGGACWQMSFSIHALFRMIQSYFYIASFHLVVSISPAADVAIQLLIIFENLIHPIYKYLTFTSHHLLWFSPISLSILGFSILAYALLASISIAAAFPDIKSNKISPESKDLLKYLDSYFHDALTKVNQLRKNLVSFHLLSFQTQYKSILFKN